MRNPLTKPSDTTFDPRPAPFTEFDASSLQVEIDDEDDDNLLIANEPFSNSRLRQLGFDNPESWLLPGDI